MEVLLAVVATDGQLFAIGFREYQLDVVSDHAGEAEAHVLAETVVLEHQAEEQIPRHAETLGIHVVDGVVVVGYLFCKVTGLLPRYQYPVLVNPVVVF